MTINTYQDEKLAPETQGKTNGFVGQTLDKDRFEARFKIEKPLGVFQAKMGGSDLDRKGSA